MLLHGGRYFGLCALNAHWPTLAPGREDGRHAELAAVGVRTVVESVVEDFDPERRRAMFARSGHVSDCSSVGVPIDAGRRTFISGTARRAGETEA